MKARLLQLEQENTKLRGKLSQQNAKMKILQQENVTFVANQRKFWELIDSWHKDCQKASSLGAINSKDMDRVGPGHSSTDSSDDTWEV